MYYTVQKERSSETALVLNHYGITVFDTGCHTVDYQRVKELT